MGPTRQEDEDSEDDEESENRNVLFAPDDLPTFPVAPKTNSFGMGYTGLDKNSQLLSSTGHFSLFEAPDSLMNSKNTGIGIKGQVLTNAFIYCKI
jgi:G patch domain-containing protein 1